MKKIFIFLFLLLISPKFVFAAEADYPERIISLAPFLTEELFLLEAQERIVGVTSYCQRPEQAKAKEKVGSITEANIEKIIMLRPDIILVSSLSDKKAKDKLEKMGFKVVEFPAAKNFEQICEQMELLGRIIGEQDKAREIIDTAVRQVAGINDDIAGLSKPKVFVQVGAKPLFTMNKDYFINDMIEKAGGVNIAKESKSGIYSREKVIEEDPDCIIIATMGIVGEEEKNIWQKYKTLNAVENDRIYIIDSYIICSPTPLSFVQSLREIVGFLHDRSKDG